MTDIRVKQGGTTPLEPPAASRSGTVGLGKALKEVRDEVGSYSDTGIHDAEDDL